MTVRRSMTALTLALSFAAVACSNESEAPKAQRQQSLQEYVDSAKGKADLAKARADGERRFGGRGTANATVMAWGLAEGTWSGPLPDGNRIELAVSRDGGGSIQIYDAQDRALANARTNATLSVEGVNGATTRPPAKLTPWTKWTLARSGGGATLKGAGAEAVAVVRR